VPKIEVFGEETRGLESYGELMTSLHSVWGTPKAARMLEEMIFRRPGSKWDQAFELTAYRELLLLHAVAIEIAAMPPVERGPVSGFGGLPSAARAESSLRGAGKPASAVGLDLDLGGSEPTVGDISAYLEPPPAQAVDFAIEATRPATLEDLPASQKPATKPVPEPELPGNLLDFDVVTPPPTPPKT
jgi:pilus assembly protein FimV